MKKVIIIGASSGLGWELARLYIDAGHHVGITGRRADLLQKFQLDYGQTGKVATACFDVTGNDNIARLENLISELGGVDLLVYNSGFGDVSPDLDWLTDKRIVDTNVNGFIEIVNWTFHHFVRQRHGHIAATSSIASNRGNSFSPAYSASKAFISTYLEGLRLKTKKLKLDIFITDIQPGFMNTKKINLKGLFWVAPVDKAARQMFRAIEDKRFRVYITRRWRLMAVLMRIVPEWIYRKIA